MKVKNSKINTQGQDEHPVNHRIRPDNMCIMEAALIGQSYLEKNPDYKKFIEHIRNFEKSDGE